MADSVSDSGSVLASGSVSESDPGSESESESDPESESGRVAIAWSYFSPAEATAPLAVLDRIIAILWTLTKR